MVPRVFTIFSFLMIFSATVYAQDSARVKNRIAFFIEGGGPAILPSLNFDTRFRGSGGWGAMGGVGLMPSDGKTEYSFALNVNYLFGKKEHFTEIGVGAGYGTGYEVILNEDVQDNFLYGQVNLGYRMQPARGLLLRLGANAMLSSGSSILVPYLGIGLSR